MDQGGTDNAEYENGIDDVYDDDEYYIWSRGWIIVPAVLSFLSIAGSYIILREVWASHHQSTTQLLPRRQRRASNNKALPYLRVLGSLSVADILYSTAKALGPVPSPSNLDGIEGNMGTIATCTAQGFVLTLGFIAAPLFNVLLAYFSFLIVNHQWTDTQLRQRMERPVHLAVWLSSCLLALLPIPLEMYNNFYEVCSITSAPADCLDSWRYGPDEATCERGDNAWILQIALEIVPRWSSMICQVIIMLRIYWYCRGLENQNQKYSSALQLGVSRSKPFAASSSRNLGKRSSSASTPVKTGSSTVLAEDGGTNNNDSSGGHAAAATTTSSQTSPVISDGRNVEEPVPPSLPPTTAKEDDEVAVLPGGVDWSDAEEPSSKMGANNDNKNKEPKRVQLIAPRTSSNEAILVRNASELDLELPRSQVNRTMSTAVAWQTFYYVLAFVATDLLWTIATIWWFASDGNYNTRLDFLAFPVFLSLQGLWNALIFCRTHEMQTPEGRLLRRVFWCKKQQPQQPP